MSELCAAEPGWLGKSDRDNHFNNWLQTEEGKLFAQEFVTVPGSKHTMRILPADRRGAAVTGLTAPSRC
jgi:hypothetical protein